MTHVPRSRTYTLSLSRILNSPAIYQLVIYAENTFIFMKHFMPPPKKIKCGFYQVEWKLILANDPHDK